MEYMAYTDSSTYERFAVATCIVLTCTRYVKSSVCEYRKVGTSAEGELLAIIQAAKNLRELQPTGKCVIKSDSQSLVERGKQILENKKVPADITMRKLWQELLDVVGDMDLEISFMQGHSIQSNPNKTCDRLSRALATTLVRW